MGKLFRSRLFWYFIFILILAIGLEEVVDDVFDDIPSGDLEAQKLDLAIATWIKSFRSPALNQIMTDLTALGSVSVLIVISIAVISILISSKHYIGLMQLSLAGLGAMIWPRVLKVFFGRERPDVLEHLVNVSDLSFPSGHSFGAAAMYITYAILAARLLRSHGQTLFWTLFAGFVIFLVGVSRIFLGVHYSTDVIGGFCAGGIWAFSVAILFEWLRPQESVKAS